jgi:hypothetical protein
MRSRFLAALLIVSLSTVSVHAQDAGTPASNAPVRVDHSAYDALLRRHVANGLVDYDAFANEPSFTRYLAAMEKIDPSLLSSDERLAFWINLYNAWTIRLITLHNERESIRNINRTLGFLKLKGPWTVPLVKAAGRTLSLDQVQYEMIRRESTDPRIHFALTCGAKSCAPLRSEAYSGDQLETQLHDQGRVFLTTDTTKNHFDVKNRTWHRNILFNHYRRDFGETRREVEAFLAQWYNDTTTMRIDSYLVMQLKRSRDTAQIARVVPDTASRHEVVSMASLLKSGRYGILDLPFDWSLNAMPRRTVTKRP